MVMWDCVSTRTSPLLSAGNCARVFWKQMKLLDGISPSLPPVWSSMGSDQHRLGVLPADTCSLRWGRQPRKITPLPIRAASSLSSFMAAFSSWSHSIAMYSHYLSCCSESSNFPFHSHPPCYAWDIPAPPLHNCTIAFSLLLFQSPAHFPSMWIFSIMNLCIRARGTTVACANIKMYPIYKI